MIQASLKFLQVFYLVHFSNWITKFSCKVQKPKKQIMVIYFTVLDHHEY